MFEPILERLRVNLLGHIQTLPQSDDRQLEVDVPPPLILVVNQIAKLSHSVTLENKGVVVIGKALNTAYICINFITVHSLPILWMEGLRALFTVWVGIIIFRS
jgi:hypothetical protein